MKSKRLFGLISVVLCIAILTAPFSAAAALPKPYTLYAKAAKAAAGITSLDVTATMSQTLTIGQFKMPLPKQSNKIKTMFTKDKRIQLESVTTDVETREVLVRNWYKDGYMYYDDGDMKLKERVSFADLFDSIGGVKWFAAGESDLKDAAIEKTDAGFYRIVYKLSVEKSFYDAWRALALSELKRDGGSDLRISDISFAITVDGDGNLKNCSIASSVSANMEDGSLIKVKSNISYKINAVNSVTKISFPSNLSAYRLI